MATPVGKEVDMRRSFLTLVIFGITFVFYATGMMTAHDARGYLPDRLIWPLVIAIPFMGFAVFHLLGLFKSPPPRD